MTSSLLSQPLIAQNALLNPGFEEGLAPWITWGDATLELTTTETKSGDQAALVRGRTASWQGSVQSLPNALEPGTTYRISAWVKPVGSGEHAFRMTVGREDEAGLVYLAFGERLASEEWTQLTEVYEHKVEGTLSRLDFYVEGPEPGVDFYVDDLEVVALPEDWQTAANQRIDQLRKRPLKVRVLDHLGQPVASASVTLEQTSKHFPMGTTLAAGPILSEPNYRQYVADRFNWGVLENESKWYANEADRGVVTYEEADHMLEFANSVGLQMRGHTIFWSTDQGQPSWVPSLSQQELSDAVVSRLDSVVSHFKGKFRHWDVNNEMLHGSFYADRLGAGIRKYMFTRTREIDDEALLFVNDFSVISYSETESYVRQIEDLLAQGFPIDAIGVQGHFDEVSPWAIQLRLNKLAKFGLPIWVTEFDVVDADENRRADKLEAFYRSAFSHPSVEGILMWGFWAGAHWKGPDAALVDLDWRINAAGQRFDQLLNEWTTQEVLATDANGTTNSRVFHGQYRITADVSGEDIEVFVEVPKGSSEIEVIVSTALFSDGFESGSDQRWTRSARRPVN